MKLFGTDGIRGLANAHPMTPDIMMRVAMATAKVFTNGKHRHTVVIGKDTRLSGYMIEPALTSGFVAMGMNVVLVGPLPTPAISMLVKSMRADLGVMISASHNAYEDNGIKFFGPDGHKLCNEKEAAIERLVDEGVTPPQNPASLGRAMRLESASGRYIEFVKNALPSAVRFDGLKIVVDCANGAGYTVAPKVLWELGADVITIADQPNGTNINKNCGAVHTEALSKAVLENQADIGIALDGDADRLVLVDEKGTRIDGDQIMALIATAWFEKGLLAHNTLVGTVMSNLGLETYLQKKGITFHRTPVGDRSVSSYMLENNLNLGGEQSGHIILSDYAKTGDGLLAALQVLSIVMEKKTEKRTLKASDVCSVFETTPQKLLSLPFENGDPMASPSFLEKSQILEKEMGNKGRLLVRKSGTEPLIRLMVEHQEPSEIDRILNELVGVLVQEKFVDAVHHLKKTG